MYNSLSDIQKAFSGDELYRVFKLILRKSPEQIKAIFAENGVEISDAAAQECFAFCEKASATKELDLDSLDNLAGGAGRLSVEKLSGILNGYSEKL